MDPDNNNNNPFVENHTICSFLYFYTYRDMSGVVVALLSLLLLQYNVQ